MHYAAYFDFMSRVSLDSIKLHLIDTTDVRRVCLSIVFVRCYSCQRTLFDLLYKMSELMSDDDDETVILASATIMFSTFMF